VSTKPAAAHWNRLRYVKDPATGNRISRLNPESDWVITEVPDLRIIDDDLWEKVRARQGALKSKGTDVPVWDRRRPRTLFSGMMTCGCCGSGFSKISKDSFGCSAARNKGRVRISEIPDSDFTKSRTAVSVIPGQLGCG
jgi:site-specific DNA recombinase